jgi:hypothetical protein
VNTDAIIDEQSEQPKTSYAAGVARAYDGGEYEDWFLPSKDELCKMWKTRHIINDKAAKHGGSRFLVSFYCSSTEYDSNYAWKQSFTNGAQSLLNKKCPFYVRPVRAF